MITLEHTSHSQTTIAFLRIISLPHCYLNREIHSHERRILIQSVLPVSNPSRAREIIYAPVSGPRLELEPSYTHSDPGTGLVTFGNQSQYLAIH
jgi:hypothetical protein